LQRTAQLCFHKSHYLASQLHNRLQLTINPQLIGGSEAAPWFREFVVQLPCSARALNENLARQSGMAGGGLDLGCIYPDESGWDKCMLLAATEVHSKADIDAFVKAIGEQLNQPGTGGS